MRALFLVAALAAAPVALQAQMSHGDHAQHQMGATTLDAELAEHFKGITLTDAQKAKLMEIKKKHHDAMDAIKKAKDAKDPAVKAELKQHMDAEHAEFKTVIGDANYAIFEANMKSHHQGESITHPKMITAPKKP